MIRRRTCVFFPLLLAFFTALPAWGNTITVTNPNDSGPGSLRNAIAMALPGDTINFSLTYPATITLSTTLSIDTSVTIHGPGASNLSISGNNVVTVLQVYPGVTASISGVTIENGDAWIGGGINNDGTLTLTESTVSTNWSYVFGGAIYNYNGTLTITNSTISNNRSNYGGGICNMNGTVAVTDSLVSDNSTGSDGGGIFSNGGTLTLTNSMVSGNSAVLGGGIFNYNHASLAITKSTVSGNSARYGGGVYDYLEGTATLTNSTMANNSSVYSGGGIFIYGATLILDNSTVSANSARSGGGIYNNFGTLTLKNTVVANSGGGNCSLLGEGATSDGYNLSDDTSCSGFLTSTTDQNNISAELDSKGLQDNGSPTKTIALLSTSPGLDAIPVADCTLSDETTPVATDQRGVTRPQGFGCDIGAFELVDSALFSSFSAKLDIQDSSSFDLNAKFALGASSNGINPLAEVVKLQVGPYMAAIPAKSFHQLRKGKKKGSWVFSGEIGGASISIQIVPLGGNSYQFKGEGSPVDLTALSNPVTVAVTIGNDTGTTSVYADF